MALAALWTALAVGLQLWAAGHAVPAQAASTPYAPAPGSTCRPREYHDKTVQLCCSMCPPGQHAKHLCTQTSDTVCADCEDSTYTQLWNWVPKCLSCGSRCGSDQVETQACTRERNRVCACKPGWFCLLGTQDSCRQCIRLRRCPPGFGVAKPGTATTDVVCSPCAPGTFSNTMSSTDPCRPHSTCSVVAVPGNASTDAVCLSEAPTLRADPETAHPPQAVSPRSQPTEPRARPSPSLSTFLPPPMGPRPPTEGSRGSVSLPIGLIVGVTALGLLGIGLVNCILMTRKKKKSSCLQREPKALHLPAEKTRGLEQQHLLAAAPSSSSSSLESSGSAAGGPVPTGHLPYAPATDEARGTGEARGSSRSPEPTPGSHGTQVNVTCIVNVCSSSDHGSQCSSQASATVGSPDANPSGSSKDEQVPFSKEECPFQSPRETPETLLQSAEEKPLPLGVPDAGMKPS